MEYWCYQYFPQLCGAELLSVYSVFFYLIWISILDLCRKACEIYLIDDQNQQFACNADCKEDLRWFKTLSFSFEAIVNTLLYGRVEYRNKSLQAKCVCRVTTDILPNN